MLTRVLSFMAFTLTEYVRSGRILIEILACAAAFYIFFRPWNTPMPADHFFSTAGLLVIALTFYTTSVVLGLGDRPQGYLVITRRLGRIGYLLGLYLAALAVELAVYGALSLAVAVANPVEALDLGGWLLGSLPLALNVAMLGALLTLLSPMVLTAGWRLLILGVVAMAFSGNLLGGPAMAALGAPITTLLDILRTVFSTPLLPAFTGFYVSVNRDYSGAYAVVPLAQLSLTLSLLALALYAFSRREIIFSQG